jgi:hypothetical protein
MTPALDISPLGLTVLNGIDPSDLSGWCVRERLAMHLRFDRQSPSNNEIKGMHHFVYRDLRQEWSLEVRAALGKRVAPKLTRAGLVLVRRCVGLLDWDNAYGGMKPILDCLVMRTDRNPSGWGIVADDSPRHIPSPPLLFQLPAKVGRGSLDILVFDRS